MDAEVRRKIEMATRVRDFALAHPFPEPSYAKVLARLEAGLTRADSLVTQQRAGRIATRGAAARKRELRNAIQSQLLRHLVRIGEQAAKERPELAGRFRLHDSGSTHKSFLTATRAMLAEAQGAKDLFVSLGLAERLLDDLGEAVALFEGAVQAGHAGRRDHISARAELDLVSRELSEVVGVLDGLNRYRFRKNPEVLAAWNNARDLLVRGRPRGGESGGEGTVPPEGGAAPAA